VSVGSGGAGAGDEPGAPQSPEGAAHDDHHRDSRRDTVLAYMPYLIIIALFSIQQIPAVDDALGATTTKFKWPGLNVVTEAGKPVSTQTFNLNWLEAAGTILLIAGILTAIVLRLRPGAALTAYGKTLVQLRTAIVTVMAVLALAYVMNTSGQTLTLGGLLAGTGGFFAVLSPVLGWLGVAVTGSDTSSNSLFGALQVTAARGAGLDPILLAAANSSGGVLGKMISPQNLAIAASAVAMSGREGEILRKVLLWSLVFLAGMCVLVYLQSTPVLSWMVVSG
jgi:lactate permease